jgi:hypothetical protein
MEPNFIRIGPPSCCSYSQSYQYNCFLEHRTSKVLLVLTKIMHPTPAADGPAFRLLLLHTRIIETTFFIVSGPPKILCTHKIMEPNFIRIGPTKLLLVLTKLSIQLFLGIGPPPRCCSYSQKSCIRHRRRMGPPFRLLLLHTRIIEVNFFMYRGPQNLRVLTKSWKVNFIRIGPP